MGRISHHSQISMWVNRRGGLGSADVCNPGRGQMMEQGIQTPLEYMSIVTGVIDSFSPIGMGVKPERGTRKLWWPDLHSAI